MTQVYVAFVDEIEKISNQMNAQRFAQANIAGTSPQGIAYPQGLAQPGASQGGLPGYKKGGIAGKKGPETIVVGEDGPEAIVPLKNKKQAKYIARLVLNNVDKRKNTK